MFRITCTAGRDAFGVAVRLRSELRRAYPGAHVALEPSVPEGAAVLEEAYLATFTAEDQRLIRVLHAVNQRDVSKPGEVPLEERPTFHGLLKKKRKPSRPAVATEPNASDDFPCANVLIVVFDGAPLTPSTHAAITRELERSKAEGRSTRLLPVSARPDRPVPPAPMNAIKALPGATPAERERVLRRAGAMVGLWTRGTGKKVFVSYRAADGKPVAEQVTSFLQGIGYDALRDDEWLEGGDRVQEEIEERLSQASLLLLIDTPRVKESEWIRKEIDGAIARFVPILPIVLRERTDRERGPRSLAVQGLKRWVPLVTRLEDGVCSVLAAEQLDELTEEFEWYLQDLLRDRLHLEAMAAERFEAMGFRWESFPVPHGIAEATRRDAQGSVLRVLAYSSPLSPTFLPAVEAFKTYRSGGHAGGTAGLRYNYRLFLHADPLARPEWTRLAEQVGLSQNAQLRILDHAQLQWFLHGLGGAAEVSS